MRFIPGTDDVVGPEGMEKFCEDIGVEPENVSLTDKVGAGSKWIVFLTVPWLLKHQERSNGVLVFMRQSNK